MRKQQKDIADLGAYGIVREALRLLRAHAKPFFLIQLTLILPFTILLFAIQYSLEIYLSKHLPQPPLPPPAPPANSTLPSDGLHERLSSKVGPGDISSILKLSLIALAIASTVMIFTLVVQAVSDSAILYSVGLIYTGKRVIFLDVLRAAIPRLWTRLTVTYLYFGVLSTFVIIINALFISLVVMLTISSNQVWVVLLASTLSVVVETIFVIYLQIIRFVASGVSILEDQNYGWAAIKKATQLLQGKKWVAVLFQGLWFFPTILTALLERPVLPPQGFNADRIWRSILLLVCSLVYTTFLSQMTALCAGVQYASFKAYHNESISDSSVKKSTHEGREPLLSENDQNEDPTDNA